MGTEQMETVLGLLPCGISLFGVIVALIGLAIKPGQLEVEWSFLWGPATNSTLVGKLVYFGGCFLTISGLGLLLDPPDLSGAGYEAPPRPGFERGEIVGWDEPNEIERCGVCIVRIRGEKKNRRMRIEHLLTHDPYVQEWVYETWGPPGTPVWVKVGAEVVSTHCFRGEVIDNQGNSYWQAYQSSE